MLTNKLSAGVKQPTGHSMLLLGLSKALQWHMLPTRYMLISKQHKVLLGTPIVCSLTFVPEKRPTQACVLELRLHMCLLMPPCTQSLADAAPVGQHLPELRPLQLLSGYLQSEHAAYKIPGLRQMRHSG